jgi:tetratricopeptide (TPR) repeat protein
MIQVPVRKLIWEALELSIETQAKRLARDIADVLGQDSAPLLKSIRDEKVSVYLFDEAGDDKIDLSEYRCSHLVTIPGQESYLTACCNPAIWSNKSNNLNRACLQHSMKPSEHGINTTNKIKCKLKRWKEYYIQEDNGYTYNQAGTLIGRYNFDKNTLTADAYTIIQKGGALSYYNTRFIKLSIDAKCVGPTHEYYDLPSGSITQKLDTIWIDDIGDGGCKTDKFDRDIRLLQQGIADEPNNGRYYFYLANSYFNTNKKADSIPHYVKRIEIGGWVEEVFYSHLNLGHAYMATGQDAKALTTWMNAYETHSARSETIYEICKYYREKGKNKLAMLFCMLGKSIPYPKNDVLFIHDDVYSYKFDYELSIVGYYNNYPNLYKITCKLMDIAPENLYNNLLSNYKFSAPKLNCFLQQKHSFAALETVDICGTSYEMRASSPCIFHSRGHWMLNVRYVNYFLENNGSYTFKINDCKIATINKLFKLDDEFKIIGEPISYIPTSRDMRYVGIEDVKVNYNSFTNQLNFVGTCQNPDTGKLAIGYGIYGDALKWSDNLQWQPVETQFNRDCEKNWSLFGNKVIYQWHPLIIGEIVSSDIKTDTTAKDFVDLDKLPDINEHLSNTVNDTVNDASKVSKKNNYKLKVIKEIKTPNYFKHVRGSSNGYQFNDEIWFLCHVVEYCQPREYYHLFAVLDQNTYEIKRWSNLFKFEGEKIEYALGLSVSEQSIIISYSKWDRDATLGIFDKVKIDTELF